MFRKRSRQNSTNWEVTKQGMLSTTAQDKIWVEMTHSMLSKQIMIKIESEPNIYNMTTTISIKFLLFKTLKVHRMMQGHPISHLLTVWIIILSKMRDQLWLEMIVKLLNLVTTFSQIRLTEQMIIINSQRKWHFSLKLTVIITLRAATKVWCQTRHPLVSLMKIIEERWTSSKRI